MIIEDYLYKEDNMAIVQISGLRDVLKKNPMVTNISCGYRHCCFPLMTPKVWNFLVNFLIAHDITHLAGQAASGISIAFALQAISNNKFLAINLGKDGYEAKKHSEVVLINSLDSYVLIDDVVSTGDAMSWSLDAANKLLKKEPEFIFAFCWHLSPIAGFDFYAYHDNIPEEKCITMVVENG